MKQNSHQDTKVLCHKHHWKDSRLFFIGSLYPSIYPWFCECGAFMKDDRTIIEPKVENISDCNECPILKFCSTTRDKPKGVSPENCPLLKKYKELK